MALRNHDRRSWIFETVELQQAGAPYVAFAITAIR